MAAGVAAGFSERFDIPVPIVRVGFVVLTFFGGFGILAYLVGWLLIPEEGHETPIAGTVFEDTESVSKWLGIGLIVAAALVALSWTNLVRGDFLFAAALLGAGVLLFRGDIGKSSGTKEVGASGADDTADSPDGSEDVASATAAALVSTPADTGGGDLEPPQAPPVVPPPPPPHPKRRERSSLGRLTFGAILLTLGIMAALDTAGLTHPSFNHYVAAIVIAAGGGLLVGGLWGRSYGLIALGLLLLPVLAIATLIRVPFGGEIGERIIQPVVAAEIGSPVEMAAGQLVLDLRDLERGQSVEIAAELGVGQLKVFVPQDRTTTVEAEVGIGSLNIFGDQISGLGREVSKVWPGGDGADPIHLKLQAGVGEILVIATEN
jgi:phage shock protein PspC (stress-responsive transcriptional regulator)